MAEITTRVLGATAKGSPLSNSEIDTNFINLNGAISGLQTALDGKEPTITTLAVAKGGTGATSLTANYLLKGNGTSAASASVVYDDGTNVGIGTSSPAVYTANSRLLQIDGGANAAEFKLTNSTTGSTGADGTLMQLNGSAFYLWNLENSFISFGTGNAERARIDSSGNLLVGKTAASGGNNGFEASVNGFASTADGSFAGWMNRKTSDGDILRFNRNATLVGSVSVTTTATAYNTSSDYRLKDIDGPIANSGAYIDALKPVQGSWKVDGSRFIGLLAHEVQEVSETQIATGEKDGEQMQAMDYSAPEIIANLIAEIQSLRARVAQLEGN